MNETSFGLFTRTYERNLAKAVADYPKEYAFPASEVPAVAARMFDAIKRRSFNKDSRAIKATCKELGIKHTYTAIDAFLGIQNGAK